MHIGHYLGAAIGPLLIIAGLVVIGAVVSARAQAGRGRLWAGLGVLIVVQLLQLAGIYLLPEIAYRTMSSLTALSTGYGILSGIGFLLGVGLVASAAAAGRRPMGHLDPTQPGAPPRYDGVGYPPVGGTPEQPPQPGTSPYEAPPPR